MTYINHIYLENAETGIKNHIPDGVIDCCISSPAYWGLRDYKHDDQLGNEPDFNTYLDRLVAIYDQVYRALKPTGTCFVNLGDTYGGGGAGTTTKADLERYKENSKQRYLMPNGKAISHSLRGTPLNKCLLMLPERFALRMIDRGWVLRNKIIWHKPNQMPSPADDRFTVDFENIYFFTKQDKGYYFEQQLEPLKQSSIERNKYEWNSKQRTHSPTEKRGVENRKAGKLLNEDGKNMRTVWSINTVPFGDAHFATYPEKLVERMIKSGCPVGGIALDPFMGAATTAVVARKLGRNYTGFEINEEYLNLGNDRLFKELGMFL